MEYEHMPILCSASIPIYLEKVLRNKYLLWGILFFAAAAPYFSSLKGEFVFDDIPLLLEDPFYGKEHSLADCWRRDYWMESMAQGLYRPLTIFSYWVNAKIAGMYSPAFRLGNLLLHVITVFLLFNLASRLRIGKTAAFLAAILFAIHPLHTEAVIPAFGRGEVLCGMFILLGLFCHTLLEKNQFWSLGTAICFILACWSKEHGVALIPLCLAYDFYSGRLKLENFFMQKGLKIYLIYMLALALVAWTRYHFMGTFLPAMTRFDAFFDNQLALCSFPIRLLSAIWLQGLAIRKFIWPQTLSHDYSYAQLIPLKTSFELATGMFLAILLVSIPFILAVLFPRLRRKILFLSAAYAICILPASNIITPTGTIFAERLFYIPSIWLCMVTACVLVQISRKIDSRLAICIFAVIFLAFSLRTYVRSFDWQDQMSISLAGVKTSPSSAKTWNNLAVELAHVNDFKSAISACDKAVEIYPSFKMGYINRAFYNIKLGNYETAERDLRKVVALGTGNPEVYNKLGAVLANLGKLNEAAKFWSISLELYANQPMIRRALDDLQNEIKQEKMKNDSK